MGFQIVSGVGVLGSLAIVLAISVLVIVAIVFFTIVKRARDSVAEDTNHDIEA